MTIPALPEGTTHISTPRIFTANGCREVTFYAFRYEKGELLTYDNNSWVPATQKFRRPPEIIEL